MSQIVLAELSNSNTDTNMKNIFSFEKYNSFEKLIRITSFVLGFIDNIKLKLENKTLVVSNLILDEINLAKCLLIKNEQKAFLSNDDIKRKFANNLSVFLDNNGLLRVKGRLQNSLLPYKAKFPILLNKNGLLVRAIIFDCHRKVLNSGLKDTLNELRFNFWVTQGRRVVNSVISKCLIYYKQQSKRFGVLSMSPLLQFRVNFTFPFSHSGVDYMGLLFVRNVFYNKDETFYKVFIVVYTCASSRAIQLDIVPDASCSSFICSFKRFISVNGVPDLYISDNAKCLTGRELKDYLSKLSTSWHYVLEVSPWWGGFWERMVQVVKRRIRKILSKSKLTYEELLTVICEIESVVNSRSLCYV